MPTDQEEKIEKVCPYCSAIIDHFNYTQFQHEYGRFVPNSNESDDGDYETDDTETDETNFECPECGHRISDEWSELDNPENIEEELMPSTPPKPKPEETEDVDHIHTIGEGKSINMPKILDGLIICKCGMIISIENDWNNTESLIECPHCSTIINVDDFKKSCRTPQLT
jgi:ssDNA-binding Zn-finger/Zn-ribbon topoisomerase 1